MNGYNKAQKDVKRAAQIEKFYFLLECISNTGLDAIYKATIGYEPITENEMTREQTIEMLSEYIADYDYQIPAHYKLMK